MHNIKILLFLLILTVTFAKSQNSTTLFFEDKIYSGYIVNNFLGYDSFPKLKPALINEFKVGHKTNGSNIWHQFYYYPEISISLLYGNLGNNKQFGKITGLIPNISFNLKNHNNSSLKINLGWGISYFDKPYDSVSNPHNILIGNNINHTATINLNYQQYLAKNLFLTFTGAYLHSSNGHYQVPNGGMNLALVSVGLKKYFGQNPLLNEQSIPEFNKKTDFYFSFGVGIHEFAGTLHPVGTPKYNVYDINLLLSRNYKYFAKYFIGASVKYYESFYYQIYKNNIYSKNIRLNSSVFTFILGNEFQFGKFAIFVYGGLNLYQPFVRNYIYKDELKFNINNIFELLISTKLGMRYYLLDPHKFNFNIYSSWAIKAHFGNADYTELAIGFVF